MSPSTSETKPETGRTPSMAASLLVLGVMIGLILLSVVLFGEEVAEGPLQVSMTLATIFALGVSYYYGFRGALITEAIHESVNSALGTVFILLAIGAIIGVLYLAGTVPAFVYYGVTLLSPRWYYITVFILASFLSILTGSSFTTVGAVGVAFVGLASLMGVSPAITAGAAVSGAFLGDNVAKISDTFVLTTAVVGGVTADAHGRMVTLTAIPTWIISAVLFVILGFTGGTSATSVDPAQVQGTIGQVYNISLLAFLPIVLIFVLSSLRISGFLSLMLSAIAGVILAGFTQQDLITSVVNNPELSYLASVLTVGIDTFANGFQLNSGNAQMDQLFSGGGTFSMFETIWLILVAASFGAIMDYTGMIQQVIAPVIKATRGPATLILATALTGIGLNVFAADPYVSIVLTGQMYRKAYIKQRLKPVVLSTTIADSGSIFSPIIPWNVHGAFVAGALGMSVMTFAPYAFMCYLSVIVTVTIGFLYFRKDRLPADEDATAVYGKEPTQLPAPHLSA